MDFKMAWRNIWRNPRRTLITVSTIAFSCLLLVFIMSFQFGGYETMINTSVKIHSGHLQLQAKDFKEKRNIRMVVEDPQILGKMLDEISGVKSYTYRSEGFSIISSDQRSFAGSVIGIDPEKEAEVSNLKSIIRQGSYLSSDDFNQALVGEHLANKLKVGLGDEIVILGQGRDGSIAAGVVTVQGIFNSGLDEFDRSTVHIRRADFEEIFTMGGAVHKVVITVKALGEVSRIKEMIAKATENMVWKRSLVVLDWKELMPGLSQSIQMDLAGAVIFYLILILVVAFSILNTFLMAIFERTKEFGVLMALGVTPGRLTRLLLIESMSITIIGIAVGICVGSLLSWFFQVHGIDISGSSELLTEYGISGRVYTRLSLLSALSGPGVMLIITFAAALYPALKVRSLTPVKALSHG